jgi:hypothetical protein
LNHEKSKALKFYLSNIKPYSDKIPYFRKVAKKIWIICWKITFKLKSIKLSVNLEKIYWVSPNAIKYARREVYYNILPHYKLKNIEKILIKDWDLTPNIIKVEERKSYKAIYAHFIEGKKWQDTDFYKIELNMVKAGMIRWGCSTEREFIERFKNLDELYKDIKNNGFKTQKMLEKKGILKHKGIREIEDEISIVIGRYGDLIRYDAQHRFALAKILNIDRIPVQILFRHEKWMEFRKEILTYIRREKNGKAYQPLLHPDLSDVPSEWSDQRFEIIRQNLSIKKGTLLNVGAHWGYFCHKFEEIGFQCTVMEDSQKNLYFLRKLRRAGNTNFKIFNKSIFDSEDYTDDMNKLNFDIVLVLDIFNQFRDITEKDLYLKLMKLFKKVKAKEMYLQVPDELKRMQHAQAKDKCGKIDRNYFSQEIIDFIIENSDFNNMDRIGEERSCGIYKLY